MALAALVLLVLLSLILIQRFDASTSEREQRVVEHGYAKQLQELNTVIATQVDWDDAIKSLDHKFSADWADFNIGNYLHTFNGFSHAFVVDGDARPIYAAVNGERADLEAYAPFAQVTQQLLPAIRAAEIKRGPFKPRPGKGNIQVPPIQVNTNARIGGQVYIITATLVQPDFGKILPKGPRAPVTITAMPVDGKMITGFGERYLLEGLTLDDRAGKRGEAGRLVLRDPQGSAVASLAWTPRRPGTTVLNQLKVPLVFGLLILCLVAWLIVRRGSTVLSELIASEARAKHLAYHDPLTGLPNRAMLFDKVRTVLANYDAEEGLAAILCVDLDRFKEVNDTLGHHAGDVLIETMATRLRAVCSEAAVIARLGGDEFVVLSTQTSEEAVRELGNRVLQAVAVPVHSEYGRLEVGCSIGAVLIDHAGVEPSEALRWADLALYRSKELGRGQLTFFEPEMDTALRNRRSLEADLRTALGDGTLRMVYQPQVDITGQITAVEALLRWDHPVRGNIPPALFVPLAEETGLILPLGEFVLRRVFAETGNWRRVRTAINVSAVQMRSPGFAALVMRLAAQAGIDPSRYEIEVTETALLCDDTVTATNIEAIKRMGFSIALDDFGTGYSSLSVLQRFSVDKIKIDRSFVSCLEDGGESEALVDAMIKLARALDLRVIAEGVETDAQRDRLASCGCSEFQGYLMGRPMSIGEVAGLAGERSPAAEVDEVKRRA